MFLYLIMVFTAIIWAYTTSPRPFFAILENARLVFSTSQLTFTVGLLYQRLDVFSMTKQTGCRSSIYLIRRIRTLTVTFWDTWPRSAPFKILVEETGKKPKLGCSTIQLLSLIDLWYILTMHVFEYQSNWFSVYPNTFITKYDVNIGNCLNQAMFEMSLRGNQY